MTTDAAALPGLGHLQPCFLHMLVGAVASSSHMFLCKDVPKDPEPGPLPVHFCVLVGAVTQSRVACLQLQYLPGAATAWLGPTRTCNRPAPTHGSCQHVNTASYLKHILNIWGNLITSLMSLTSHLLENKRYFCHEIINN